MTWIGRVVEGLWQVSLVASVNPTLCKPEFTKAPIVTCYVLLMETTVISPLSLEIYK